MPLPPANARRDPDAGNSARSATVRFGQDAGIHYAVSPGCRERLLPLKVLRGRIGGLRGTNGPPETKPQGVKVRQNTHKQLYSQW